MHLIDRWQMARKYRNDKPSKHKETVITHEEHKYNERKLKYINDYKESIPPKDQEIFLPTHNHRRP